MKSSATFFFALVLAGCTADTDAPPESPRSTNDPANVAEPPHPETSTSVEPKRRSLCGEFENECPPCNPADPDCRP